MQTNTNLPTSDTKTILLTVPGLQDRGGVVSFYNGVLPYFPKGKIMPLEIGSTRNAGGLLHPLVDQIRFLRAARKKKPALVHLNPSLDPKSFIRDGFFAWQVKKYGLPLLVFWRGWDKDFEAKIEKKYMWFFRKTFGQADGFIVLASEFERKLRDWGVSVPIFRETTCVAENLLAGVEVQKKWADSSRLSLIKILFLARLERAKGVFETVQAVKLLLDKNFSVCLTIAGDGKIRQELEEYTRSLNLSPQHVNFTGDIRGEYKIRAFAEHHIYCFPTFYGEGLPNSVLEAMAFGMPVVTRPVGGLADIFEDEKMGALVQGKSPQEIADCLERIIADRSKMAEIGRYNAGYAKEHFMASKVAGRLKKIYADIIDSQNKKAGGQVRF